MLPRRLNDKSNTGRLIMDIIEAINSRKSIRGYKSDPVPREMLEKILEIASRAPSAMNTQPWEFFVLGGDVLDKIRNAVVSKLNNGEPLKPEHNVTGWPKESIFRERQVELA